MLLKSGANKDIRQIYLCGVCGPFFSYLEMHYFPGVVYFDAGGILYYIFDSLSGKLLKVGGYIHNVTLSLQYSEGNLQAIEHSHSGKRLSINYTSSDLIQSIQRLDSDNRMELAT